jgi:hypothetical protein
MIDFLSGVDNMSQRLTLELSDEYRAIEHLTVKHHY